jgi:hypothetical protein
MGCEEAYGYTEVRWSGNGVRLGSTNPDLLHWARTEVERIRASCSTTSHEYFLHLTKLSGSDEAVAWWIVGQLCLYGWEPLSGSLRLGESLTLKKRLQA